MQLALNTEMIYRHCFTTLFQIMPLGRFK